MQMFLRLVTTQSMLELPLQVNMNFRSFFCTSLFKRSSARLSHQTSIFKFHASMLVQLSPMAFSSARREALSQPTIRKPLEGAVYPSEAKGLFHHINVWYSLPLGAFTAIGHHPTTSLFVVVLFKPLT